MFTLNAEKQTGAKQTCPRRRPECETTSSSLNLGRERVHSIWIYTSTFPSIPNGISLTTQTLSMVCSVYSDPSKRIPPFQSTITKVSRFFRLRVPSPPAVHPKSRLTLPMAFVGTPTNQGCGDLNFRAGLGQDGHAGSIIHL